MEQFFYHRFQFTTIWLSVNARIFGIIVAHHKIHSKYMYSNISVITDRDNSFDVYIVIVCLSVCLSANSCPGASFVVLVPLHDRIICLYMSTVIDHMDSNHFQHRQNQMYSAIPSTGIFAINKLSQSKSGINLLILKAY